MFEKHFDVNLVRWAGFFHWTTQHIPTRNVLEGKCLPKSLNGKYDMFFAGSDQLWNYHFASSRFDDFFLTFADPAKRIAISGSFGVEEIPGKWQQTYRDGLCGFAHLSVREDAGARIVKDLTGRDAPVLVDPTMLLSRDEWLKTARKPRVDCTKPYVLKYYLGDEAEEEKIDTWAKENDYEIYEMCNKKNPNLYVAGPGEFISLIANADLVCSDSFHCIVFSIIFGKPFVVYSRRGNADYMTSRLDTLLGKFGFQERWKHLLAPERYLSCDYSRVDTIMAAEREKVMTYIQQALMKEGN